MSFSCDIIRADWIGCLSRTVAQPFPHAPHISSVKKTANLPPIRYTLLCPNRWQLASAQFVLSGNASLWKNGRQTLIRKHLCLPHLLAYRWFCVPVYFGSYSMQFAKSKKKKIPLDSCNCHSHSLATQTTLKFDYCKAKLFSPSDDLTDVWW